MLSKLTVGFLLLATTAAIVACSNLGMTTGVNVGPNFPSKTLYATNTNQNAVSVYSNGTSESKLGGGPAYEIGGANTTLDGPQYVAFDRRQNLWVTNYNFSTQKALLIEFAALATGNVDPLNSGVLPGRPRGIAFTPRGPSPLPSSSVLPAPAIMAVSDVDPTDVYPSRILLFTSGAVVAVPVHRRPQAQFELARWNRDRPQRSRLRCQHSRRDGRAVRSADADGQSQTYVDSQADANSQTNADAIEHTQRLALTLAVADANAREHLSAIYDQREERHDHAYRRRARLIR